jgi:hypothetical protein
MVTPTLLLLSALFVQLDARPRLVSLGWWSRLRVGTVLVLFVAALVSFDVGESNVRGSPTWSEALDAGRATCAHTNVADVELPIAPNVFPFGVYHARFPCSELAQSSMGAAAAQHQQQRASSRSSNELGWLDSHAPRTTAQRAASRPNVLLRHCPLSFSRRSRGERPLPPSSLRKTRRA